eukprot:TRINITY_DN35863_c0_g1_i1.p1 TRINITY_DN35863_c0_g1~~TRINITY_DN35863_c0_g1_i1.p1  ORF type:complete len:490 (+),score=182.43 TRINITY_DN35863_c0_g1_i1:668-2137(+)
MRSAAVAVLCASGLALATADVKVQVDVARVQAETDGNYVCVGMDWWPANKCNWNVCPWGDAGILTSDLQDPALLRVVKDLGGVYLRIGGSLCDGITYKAGGVQACPGMTPTPSANATWFEGGCLTMERWDQINAFAQLTGAKLVFALNANYNRSASPTNDWDPSNAAALMEYTVAKGYDVFAWEFGNELGYNASVFAKGLVQLRDVLAAAYSGAALPLPKIIAPDEIRWDDSFFGELIPLVSDFVYAVTWHSYPLGAGYDNPNLNKHVMDPSQHDSWMRTASDAANLTHRLTGGKMKVWMGESGGAYDSGHNGTSNRFLYAFWYLDSMAGLAAAGQDVFCRQAFIGGNYELVNHETFDPNPDYYGALLFKRLMGPKVLTAGSDSSIVRAWSHCTQDGSSSNVTMLLMNFGNSTVSVDVPQSSQPRMEYHMTAPFINSTQVYLNGRMLSQPSPSLDPILVAADQPVTLTNTSYAFVVYTPAAGGVCGGQS